MATTPLPQRRHRAHRRRTKAGTPAIVVLDENIAPIKEK
jgi:hypothetical protein